MKEWEGLFDCAMKQIRGSGIPRESWTFGGGTSLMHAYNHRDSKDIDIFLSSPQLLTHVTPRLNDAIEHEVGRYDEQSNFVRIYLERGEIDFIHSRQVSECQPALKTIRGVTLFVDDPVEVIAKKVFYRADEFKSRDVFDLAVVYSKCKEDMLRSADTFMPHLVTLKSRVSELISSGQLERECSELRLLEYGMEVRGHEIALYSDFLDRIG